MVEQVTHALFIKVLGFNLIHLYSGERFLVKKDRQNGCCRSDSLFSVCFIIIPLFLPATLSSIHRTIPLLALPSPEKRTHDGYVAQ